MKKFISVLFAIVLAFSINAQTTGKEEVFENETQEGVSSKFIEDIKFSTKNIVIEPNKFKVVELFNINFSFMLDETGESEYPFQMVKPKKDLETQINYLSGEQTKVTHAAWIAKPLYNADDNWVDEYNPNNLTAEKKRKKKGKLYVEYGDFYIEIPDERLVINEKLYFFFKGINPYTNKAFIITTVVDEDFRISIEPGTNKVYFVNNEQYYILTEEEIEVEQRDRLTFAKTKKEVIDEIVVVPIIKPTQSYTPQKETKKDTNPPMYHRFKKGDTLSQVAKDYRISLEKIKSLNPKVGDPTKIPVGTLVRVR